MFCKHDNLTFMFCYVPLCVRSSVQIIVNKCYHFTTLTVPYPPELLDTNDFPDLQCPSGAVLDIMQILSEFLININYEDIDLVPRIMVSEAGVKSISTFPTCEAFQLLCEKVSEQWGPDTFPLVLQFNMDGMPTDSLGKRSLKPYKIRIKNVSDRLQMSTSNIFTVAYGPVHHYTKPQLLAMLETTETKRRWRK